MSILSSSAVDVASGLNWQAQQTALSLLQHHWLFSRELLTQQLRDLSQQQFAVQPLREYYAPLREDECHALGIAPHSQGWIREVLLLGQQQPWVYARSVACQQQMQRSSFDLATLGNRSLGEHLFKQNAFQRLPIEVSPFPLSWLPAQLNLAECSQPLWARRSCFAHAELQVLVAETFLPSFWHAAQQASALD